MSAGTIPQVVDIPDDPAMPGMSHCAQPERMLELVTAAAENLVDEERTDYSNCTLTEAVYQPGRACRIAYTLSVPGGERPEMVYARWPAEKRAHASAIRVGPDGEAFDLFRYPRDRRLRQVRAMRREDWLTEASAAWFSKQHGMGRFTHGSWRCSPIKYVPESRLVCRLKGEWATKGGKKWCRAYVRISRRNNAVDQFELLNRLTIALNDCNCGLAVPTPLGIVPRQHLFATDFIRGRVLRDAIAGARFDEIIAGCHTLSAISRLRIDIAEVPPAGDRLDPMVMLGDLKSVLPLPDGSAHTLDLWASTQPTRPRVDALVHGDLHAGQIIQKHENLFVVDWDACHLGDPTQDIMNLAAEIEYSTRLMRDESTANDLAATCVAAWRSGGGSLNSLAARWWATHAFVLRAWGLLRHFRSGWRGASIRLLERAAEIYSGGAAWTD